MEWLSENWTWILLLVGGYSLMSRMGMGCGMGHSHGDSHTGGEHGGRTHNGGHDHAAEPVKLFDPVSQHMLPAETAIASVHQGHVYYFEDRANRDAFETEPEKYLAGAPPIGQKIVADGAQEKKAHRAHGCCG